MPYKTDFDFEVISFQPARSVPLLSLCLESQQFAVRAQQLHVVNAIGKWVMHGFIIRHIILANH